MQFDKRKLHLEHHTDCHYNTYPSKIKKFHCILHFRLWWYTIFLGSMTTIRIFTGDYELRFFTFFEFFHRSVQSINNLMFVAVSNFICNLSLIKYCVVVFAGEFDCNKENCYQLRNACMYGWHGCTQRIASMYWLHSTSKGQRTTW